MKLGLVGSLIAVPFVIVGFVAASAWAGLCSGYLRALQSIEDYAEEQN